MPLDDALHDPLRGNGGARRHRLVGGQLGYGLLLLLLVVGQQLRIERLGELGAVAVERVGLQGQPPGQHVGLLAVLHGRLVRHVDGLGDGAGDEGLGCRHHVDVARHRQRALALAPAGAGAVEDRQMLLGDVRRAFQRHGPAHVLVGRLDVLFRVAQMQRAGRTPGPSAFRLRCRASAVRNCSPSVQRLKANLMSKAVLSASSSLRSTASVKPLALSVA